MQYGSNAISFGQIKLSKVEAGKLPVPGVQEFASLFSGALTLKIGDGSKIDDRKRQGSGESALWGHWSS